jgi:Uma2 family endonuclease
MAEMTPAELEALGIEWPPTEDELPCDDGMPMETQRHALQMQLLIDPLRLFWADRMDAYVGGNMFIYFSLEQVRHQDFRGPDFFAVLGVPKRERKSWVVWQEGKGPDVVIELLSESTAAQDKGEKKDIYQDRLRVPEYFWFDPFTAEWAGFTLRNRGYEPLTDDSQGRLISQCLGLALLRWDGIYQDVEARWLRWATLEGVLLPTPQEVASEPQQQAAATQHQATEALRQATEAQRQAAAAQQQATEAQRQAAEAQQQAAEAQRQAVESRDQAAVLEALLARYRERFGDLPE